MIHLFSCPPVCGVLIYYHKKFLISPERDEGSGPDHVRKGVCFRPGVEFQKNFSKEEVTMRRWYIFFAVFLAVAFLVSFSYRGTTTAEEGKLPPADPRAVYKYITEQNSYKNWDLWPGKGKLYKGKKPHGAFLTTYVNSIALGSIKAGEVMAGGSIVVKENYTPEKKLAAVTVMYKVKGYNPEAGNWFWAKYGADGSVAKAGKVKGCINCHSARKGNDFIFTGDFVGKK
jgi:hypothetical protein